VLNASPALAVPERGVMTLQDATPLQIRVWSAATPQRIVIGVHGFNDYSKAFDPLARSLVADLQATVYAYDQRGFGANPSPGVWPGADRLIDDLREIVDQLRARHPGLPITVIGESMGGAVVLRASTESPGLPVSQLILKAPALWGAETMPWYQRAGLQMMNAVAPNFTFSGRGLRALGIKPTDDPEVARDLSRDPLFIKETRVSSLVGVTDLMGQALHHPMSFSAPTLVLYGLNDRIIPHAPVCSWLSRLDGESSSLPGHVQFLIYPEGWHLLTRQLRAAEVIRDITQWIRSSALQQRVGSLPAGPTAGIAPLAVQAARQKVCQR
jgi:alpha-beta hydrolase superfamily lysophospholipase